MCLYKCVEFILSDVQYIYSFYNFVKIKESRINLCGRQWPVYPAVNTMAADDLLTQGTRTSVAMVIKLFSQNILVSIPGPRFNIKMSYQYRKSHCGDKTVVRSSYLHNGISILVRCHLYIESGPRRVKDRLAEDYKYHIVFLYFVYISLPFLWT